MNILAKLQALFADSKMRIVLILFILLIVIGTVTGIIFAVRYMTGPLGAAGEASLKSAPQITSVVGGWEGDVSPAYRKSQEQFNREQVEKAKKEGTSAVPSLIESKPISQPLDQVSGGVGFEALKNAQQEEGIQKNVDLSRTGSLVYDANGNPIGAVGEDGLVRDACGKVVGRVLPDGRVVDLSGKPIGKVGANAAVAGSLVYDDNGNVIGTVGPDGLVRDASGKVVGKVMPDGRVVDLSGKPIGKVGSSGAATGSLVYDENGKVIGTVGADGLVRDANGNVVGKVLPDGSVVDSSGKIIGKANGGGTTAGSLVYDAKGNVIGVVGKDGLIRDATGKVVGKVLPDGSAVDMSGKPLGSVGKGAAVGSLGSVPPGSLVYDDKGNLIGTVGADGLVRDANGKVVGKVGPDGLVRDAHGNVIGRAVIVQPTAPPAAAVPATPAPTGAVTLPSAPVGPQVSDVDKRYQAALARQQAALTDQQRAQMQQQIQTAMAGQAGQLFTAWASPTQDYVAGTPDKDEEKAKAAAAAAERENGRSSSSSKGPLLVKAGSVVYAILDTAVNSDEPGPVLATIVEGKLKGMRLMGTLTRQEKRAMLTFTVLTGDALPSKASINAVAIDPDTARTTLASDVDSHYLLRYGSLFAGALMQGYATAITQSGSVVTQTPLGGSQQTLPTTTAQQKVMVALGNVGTRYQAVMGSNFTTPPTITINSGVGLGILFLDDVVEPQ